MDKRHRQEQLRKQREYSEALAEQVRERNARRHLEKEMERNGIWDVRSYAVKAQVQNAHASQSNRLIASRSDKVLDYGSNPAESQDQPNFEYNQQRISQRYLPPSSDMGSQSSHLEPQMNMIHQDNNTTQFRNAAWDYARDPSYDRLPQKPESMEFRQRVGSFVDSHAVPYGPPNSNDVYEYDRLRHHNPNVEHGYTQPQIADHEQHSAPAPSNGRRIRTDIHGSGDAASNEARLRKLEQNKDLSQYLKLQIEEKNRKKLDEKRKKQEEERVEVMQLVRQQEQEKQEIVRKAESKHLERTVANVEHHTKRAQDSYAVAPLCDAQRVTMRSQEAIVKKSMPVFIKPETSVDICQAPSSTANARNDMRRPPSPKTMDSSVCNGGSFLRASHVNAMTLQKQYEDIRMELEKQRHLFDHLTQIQQPLPVVIDEPPQAPTRIDLERFREDLKLELDVREETYRREMKDLLKGRRQEINSEPNLSSLCTSPVSPAQNNDDETPRTQASSEKVLSISDVNATSIDAISIAAPSVSASLRCDSVFIPLTEDARKEIRANDRQTDNNLTNFSATFSTFVKISDIMQIQDEEVSHRYDISNNQTNEGIAKDSRDQWKRHKEDRESARRRAGSQILDSMDYSDANKSCVSLDAEDLEWSDEALQKIIRRNAKRFFELTHNEKHESLDQTSLQSTSSLTSATSSWNNWLSQMCESNNQTCDTGEQQDILRASTRWVSL